MQHGIHFISGLPRAGSTLLAGILRQDPHFHAAMTSPIGTLFAGLLGQMSQTRHEVVSRHTCSFLANRRHHVPRLA